MPRSLICPKCGHNAKAGKFLTIDKAMVRKTCKKPGCSAKASMAYHNLIRDEAIVLCGDHGASLMAGWLQVAGWKVSR